MLTLREANTSLTLETARAEVETVAVEANRLWVEWYAAEAKLKAVKTEWTDSQAKLKAARDSAYAKLKKARDRTERAEAVEKIAYDKWIKAFDKWEKAGSDMAGPHA